MTSTDGAAMEFSNYTPFPALAFESFAPDGASFHTVVLRQTFELRHGSLVLAQQQKPLATSDRFHGEPNLSSVAEESDLAPYKPFCDVLVNGTAYAPQGRAVANFSGRRCGRCISRAFQHSECGSGSRCREQLGHAMEHAQPVE